MKTVGMVRRVDDLGRVAIPKEIRQFFTIRDGDPLQITVVDGGILMKKYSPMKLLRNLADNCAASIIDIAGKADERAVFICDRDTIVAVDGINTKKDVWVGRRLLPEISEILDGGQPRTLTYSKISTYEDDPFVWIRIIPIITSGNSIGSVIISSKTTPEVIDELKINAAASAIAQFIGHELRDGS